MVDESDASQCCPPDCCVGLARGFLNFQILWELDKERLNGQQIAEQISKRRGSKPTPGTIYPALKELNKGRYIEGEKVGRQIVYHLTPRGSEALLEASRYFLQAFGDIAEDVKAKVVIMGNDDCKC
jgi:PadR family transcriptional regulator PadR